MNTGLRPKTCLRIFMTVSLNYETPTWHQHLCFSIFYSYLNNESDNFTNTIVCTNYFYFITKAFCDLSLPDSISLLTTRKNTMPNCYSLVYILPNFLFINRNTFDQTIAVYYQSFSGPLSPYRIQVFKNFSLTFTDIS